jgi:hypothetical protein
LQRFDESLDPREKDDLPIGAWTVSRQRAVCLFKGAKKGSIDGLKESIREVTAEAVTGCS